MASALAYKTLGMYMAKKEALMNKALMAAAEISDMVASQMPAGSIENTTGDLVAGIGLAAVAGASAGLALYQALEDNKGKKNIRNNYVYIIADDAINMKEKRKNHFE